MSSIYINEFHDPNNRKNTLTVIDDLVSGNSLKHFKKRFIDEKVNPLTVDWKKRYTTSNYISTILNEYMDYIQPLTKTNDNKNTGDFDERKSKVLEVFFKNNDWESLVKNLGYSRKKYGDVYLYWFIDKDQDTDIEYPKFILLDSKFVEIKLDDNRNIFAYTYEEIIRYQEEMGNGNFVEKQKNVKWVFKKGQVDRYSNGMLEDTIKNRKELKDHIPIIHMQFLVDINTKYSIIPVEPLIDLALDLDYIETSISYTNKMSGFPQLVVIDGVVDSASSGFGPNSIVYVDTVVDEGVMDENYKRKFQAKVTQLEITNKLQSSQDEKNDKVELLYSKANLISPKGYMALAKSDSSKVLESSRKDLEKELRGFYEELSSKFSPILKILYSINKIEFEGDIKFVIPDHVIEQTTYDKNIEKAQLMNIGELTLQENLREKGLTEKEISQHISELNSEKVNGKNDITINTNDGGIKKDETKGVDNITKIIK